MTAILPLGILAGVWPCGTVTLLGELFGAEGKGQVYGHLHAHVYDNQSRLSTLSKLLLTTVKTQDHFSYTL